jgi:23S rRNA (uracil1939-C5)-methyltransferase
MKRSWLLEQFKRVCKQTPPGLESMEALESWQYRRVVDWHWEKNELGYRNAQGELIPISTCEIVQGGQKSLLKAKKLMQALNIESAKLRWIQNSERTLAVIEIPSLEKAPLIIEKISNFWPESELDGLHLVHKHEGLCHLGHQEIAENIEGLAIKWHVQGFLQNHLQGSLSFYRWLENKMERQESETRSIWLDLYCGTGVTAIMAARQGWNVFGYEISAPAIKMARKNAKANKWDATCHFDVRDLNRPLDKLVPEPKKLGGILVNPPRTGLSRPIIEYINASACQKILYLSCDPATLCRDLKLFLENGFQLKDWKTFDCFAQTSHFETAAMLVRD